MSEVQQVWQMCPLGINSGSVHCRERDIRDAVMQTAQHGVERFTNPNHKIQVVRKAYKANWMNAMTPLTTVVGSATKY